MGKVSYVKCPKCKRDYYIDKNIVIGEKKESDIKLKCPFCKYEFDVQEGFNGIK